MGSNTKLTVDEYKKLYDENNYKKNNYQICLFINFLTNEGIIIKEIENLTGIKKSQIHNYKKIIKMEKINVLKTSTFRDVLKSCNETKPTIDNEIVKEIEKVEEPDIHPRAHYFNEIEYSPGKSSYRKKDMCEKCGSFEVGGGHLPGQREVHIPDLGVMKHTIRRLQEIVEHEDHVNWLKNKITELETKLEASEKENRELRERLGEQAV